MDHEQILDKMKYFETQLTSKGYQAAGAYFRINWCGYPYFIALRADIGDDYAAVHFDARPREYPTLDSAMAACQQFIDDLKTPEQVAKENWVAKLGKLIDEGRDCGMDDIEHPLVDFSDLETIMKSLSENILTDQSASVVSSS